MKGIKILLLILTAARMTLHEVPEPEAVAIPLRMIVTWVGILTGGAL